MTVNYNAATDTYDVSVTVTNTGDMAGKETVQIYLQSPYTQYDIDNLVEKSAVQLIGFGKTDILQPGASETLTVSVDKRDMAAYDAYGAGTYILDAGNYYLTAATDAHNAVNNVLAAKGYTTADGMDAKGEAGLAALVGVSDNQNDKKITSDDLLIYSVADTNVYSILGEDGTLLGEKITNRFDNADPKIFEGGVNYGPGALGGAWTYVTRNDWAGTVK
jgi:beta-glucosidase